LPSRLIAVGVMSAALFSSCGNQVDSSIGAVTTGGDIHKGAAAITRYGCGSCHTIPGISGANGRVGSPLTGMADREYIAGVIRNTPDGMVRWIQNPHVIDEKTAMPDLGVTHQDAADIAAYIYTLK
jgi:cytochrome c